MTAVVEVGPATVRGPAPCDRDTARAALAAVDDELAVVGEDVVEVAALWREVLAMAVGDDTTAVVVCPGWWSAARIAVIDAAASGVLVEHEVLQRSCLLADEGAVTLEVADDLLVWTPPGGGAEVVDRDGADLNAGLGGVVAAQIDLPQGVVPLSDDVLAALRARGVALTWTTPARLRAAALAAWQVTAPAADTPWWHHRRALPIGAAAAGVGCVLAALLSSQPPASTTVAEGRMAVSVPADWRVQRLTEGPGSDRLRVSAPDDSVALHLTHSIGVAGTPLPEVAESLRRAMRSEAPGVFSDPDPHGLVDGRPAVTYREHRADATTTWAVVVDGDVRIAVGCQVRRPSGGADAACAAAVRSAHALR